MKLKFFLIFIIAINFSSVNNSNHSPQRKLDSPDIYKLLLIGFGLFQEEEDSDQVNFDMYLKKIDNTLNFSDIYLKSLVEYENGTTKDNVDIICGGDSESESQYLIYNCEINISNFTNIQINNYTFILTNKSESKNFSLSKEQIFLSSLAEQTIKNIENQTYNSTFNIFYLNKEPNITKNEVILYGKIDDDGKQENFSFYLNLPENTNCTHYYFSDTREEKEIITFTLINNTNAHLNGMVSEAYTDHNYILIFSNTTDYLVLYSKEEITYVDLLGFGSYTRPTQTQNAKNQVYFKGTANNLKNFVRFTATISNSSSLRALAESKVVNATGNRTFINVETGLAIYNVSYNETAGMTDIVSIIPGNEYKFSNYMNNFPSTPVTINFIGDNMNLTSNEQVLIEFIDPIDRQPTISGNTFSFDINIPKTNQSLNISNKQTMYLNYANLDDLERDEIYCSIENKTSKFTILCEPQKDVYTEFKSLIIKIPKISSSRRLRFLQSTGNSTYYFPTSANGDIQFMYNPEINSFTKKSSKKKGLSGGAITAIVLATIAAVAAVGIAIFFLNRGPISPIKSSTEVNIPNSTTNINN